MKARRVLVADDHPLIREGVVTTLRSNHFEVAAQAANGREVLALVPRVRPDLILLDLAMPEMDGLTCLRHIRLRYPGLKVVVFTEREDERVRAEASKAGASGFISKRIDPGAFVTTLPQILAGRGTPGIETPEGSARLSDSELSGRERVVLAALSEGKSNSEIARSLWLSEATVKFHLANIYRKLGVKNRTEATRAALDNRLVA